MPVNERSWSCTCGATLSVPAWCPDDQWARLVATFRETHTGEGHAECDRKTASQARARAKRREA